MPRALVIAVALLALGGLVALGLGQARPGSGERPAPPAFDLASARRALAGAPAPLAALHAEGNALLGGGRPAFAARLRALRGYPVVVNKWASWCGPCRAEFPVLQRAATARGRAVAFVGLNSSDGRDAARTFLRDHPLPFPSYLDADGAIADSFARTAFPTTIFVDPRGRTAYVHQGPYGSPAELGRDIDRYLGSAAR